MRFLVLGKTGMLGRELFQQLQNHSNEDIEVFGTIRNVDKDSEMLRKNSRVINNFNVLSDAGLLNLLDDIKPNVILNCIGIVKQFGSEYPAKDYYYINSIVPRIIDHWCRLNSSIQITFSTDCVFSGNTGHYDLTDSPDATDVYGLSKALGEVLDSSTITVRTSIVGLEANSQRGLLEWFLDQPNKTNVTGYRKVWYSGLSTTYLAETIINESFWKYRNGLVQIGGPRINKYDLLKIFKEIFCKDISVIPADEPILDRSFHSKKFYREIGQEQPAWKYLISHLRQNTVDRRYN